MRHSLTYFLMAASLVGLVACGTTEPVPDKPKTPPKHGHDGTEETDATPTPKPVITPSPVVIEPEVTPVPTPTPTPAAADYPVASPVEGKPGFVVSPFNAGGIVDVRGYPPGTEVRDPYSGKIFLVP